MADGPEFTKNNYPDGIKGLVTDQSPEAKRANVEMITSYLITESGLPLVANFWRVQEQHAVGIVFAQATSTTETQYISIGIIAQGGKSALRVGVVGQPKPQDFDFPDLASPSTREFSLADNNFTLVVSTEDENWPWALTVQGPATVVSKIVKEDYPESQTEEVQTVIKVRAKVTPENIPQISSPQDLADFFDFQLNYPAQV